MPLIWVEADKPAYIAHVQTVFNEWTCSQIFGKIKIVGLFIQGSGKSVYREYKEFSTIPIV